ncbi:MAG: GIY-YIG nuclease family protein [Terrimicrobiaceae bacterium]
MRNAGEGYQVYGIYTKGTNILHYVGYTKQSLQVRFGAHKNGSNMKCSKYIQENGVDNFEIRQLAASDSSTDMKQKEKQFIKKFCPHLNISGNPKCIREIETPIKPTAEPKNFVDTLTFEEIEFIQTQLPSVEKTIRQNKIRQFLSTITDEESLNDLKQVILQKTGH